MVLCVCSSLVGVVMTAFCIVVTAAAAVAVPSLSPLLLLLLTTSAFSFLFVVITDTVRSGGVAYSTDCCLRNHTIGLSFHK